MADTDQIIAKLAADTAPIASARTPAALFVTWLLVSGLYALALIYFQGLRDDLALKLHSPLFAAEVAALLLMVITSALAASVLAFPDLHQKRGLAFAPVLPLLLFIVILAMEWVQDNPPAPAPEHRLLCTACIAFYALVPAALMIALMRRQASTHYYSAGAVALLASASVGCLALRFAEKTDSIPHLVEWHYLPILGFALTGIFLGRRFLKW